MKAILKAVTRMLYALGIIVFVINSASAQTTNKHRLIVITDIGNEPDDFMSMVRLIIENL